MNTALDPAGAGHARAPLVIAMIAACPFPYPRGTPIRIHRLANALAARGHDVHVFAYHLGVDSTGDGITVHRSPRVPTYSKVGPGPSLQKLLVVDPLLTGTLLAGFARRRFDVIHAHHYEGLLVAKAAKIGRRIPLVYDAHTLLGSELPTFKVGLSQSLSGRFGARLDAWLPRLADHVIAVTTNISERLVADGMDRGRVSVVMNGVEQEMFPAAAAAARKDPATLIFTGNLARYQGIDYMLRAFALVVAKRKDARLVLVTRSAFEPYEPLAAELGVRASIDLVPAPFSEQAALLGRAAVALNPRVDGDGVPQKLLNYMAAGCATVSFTGQAPTIEHGQTGFIVPKGDVAAFAAAVLELLEQPALAESLGRRAREIALTRYTWEVAAEKSEAVYRRLLARRGVAAERADGSRSVT